MPKTLMLRINDSENNYTNESFWHIYPMFLLVKEGNVEELKKAIDIQLDRFPETGRISRDERKQMEYLTVALIVAFMIAAIQGGVYPPEANWISDQALTQLSHLRQPAEIPALVTEAALLFCEKVRETREGNTGNPHVEQIKNYISSHLTQPITLQEIADAVGLSKYHMCRLFKSLTGKTINEQIIDTRIELAKQMLLTGEYTITEISSLLQFCDQSYFTRVFREVTDETPNVFRDNNKT